MTRPFRWEHRRRACLPPARYLLSLSIACLIGVAGERLASAQATWDYAPYEVLVLLAVEASAELPPAMTNELVRAIPQIADVVFGATWNVVAEPATAAVAPSLVWALELLTIDDLDRLAADAMKNKDKILLVALRADDQGVLVQAREVDCRARILGRLAQRRIVQRELLAKESFATIAEAFSPVARIEDSRGKSATVRLRASGLVQSPENPAAIATGEVLQAVIRRDDRLGKPQAGGVTIVPWTTLIVTGIEGAVLSCQVDSATRNLLGGRGSPRIQRYALALRPRGNSTRLKLVSTDSQPVPLEGYEIYSKIPVQSDEKKNPEFLGRTDWRGVIEVPRSPDQLARLLYVKNGQFLLARLPLVPGYETDVTATLNSDDKRLEAEAFVKGIESTVMDLVARRAIIAARIDRRLAEGKRDAANTLLEELRSLPTKDDLELMITNRQSSLTSTNEREQERIDRLLAGTRILLAKYLSTDLETSLARKIEQGGAAEAPAATTPPEATNPAS